MKLPWTKKREISVYDIKDLEKYLETRLQKYVTEYDLGHFENKKDHERIDTEYEKTKDNWKKEMRWTTRIGIGIVILFIWLEILTAAVFSSHH